VVPLYDLQLAELQEEDKEIIDTGDDRCAIVSTPSVAVDNTIVGWGRTDSSDRAGTQTLRSHTPRGYLGLRGLKPPPAGMRALPSAAATALGGILLAVALLADLPWSTAGGVLLIAGFAAPVHVSASTATVCLTVNLDSSVAATLQSLILSQSGMLRGLRMGCQPWSTAVTSVLTTRGAETGASYASTMVSALTAVHIAAWVAAATAFLSALLAILPSRSGRAVCADIGDMAFAVSSTVSILIVVSWTVAHHVLLDSARHNATRVGLLGELATGFHLVAAASVALLLVSLAPCCPCAWAPRGHTTATRVAGVAVTEAWRESEVPTAALAPPPRSAWACGRGPSHRSHPSEAALTSSPSPPEAASHARAGPGMGSTGAGVFPGRGGGGGASPFYPPTQRLSLQA
jgi:hypothetical protein